MALELNIVLIPVAEVIRVHVRVNRVNSNHGTLESHMDML